MLQAVFNFWCRWRTAENRWFDFLHQPRITSHITWKYWYLINNKLNLFPVLVDTKHFTTENALFFTTRKETIVEVFIFSYLKIIKKIMLVLNALFFRLIDQHWGLYSLLLPFLRSVFSFFLDFSLSPTWELFTGDYVFHVLKANAKPQMLPRTPFRCVRKIKKHNGLLIKCLLTELGLAKQKNIWLLIRTHGPRFTRSVGADLEPNIFLSGPPTQP